MRAIFLAISLSALSLCALLARDDPFESPKQSEDSKSASKTDVFTNFNFKLPSTARKIKEITITYQNIDGSVDTQKFSIEKGIDWHYPISVSQLDAHIDKSPDYYSENKIIFFIKDSKLYISAKRKMLRDFILPEPFRILIDFSKEDGDVEKKLNIDDKYYKAITLIPHKDFLRVQLTLDGNYQYEVSKNDDGYILNLK